MLNFSNEQTEQVRKARSQLNQKEKKGLFGMIKK
jgi:hypothetical protein